MVMVIGNGGCAGIAVRNLINRPSGKFIIFLSYSPTVIERIPEVVTKYVIVAWIVNSILR